jgi:peptide/nickel transport system permease protein
MTHVELSPGDLGTPLEPARTPFAKPRRHRWLTGPVIAGFLVVAFWLITAVTISWWAPYKPLIHVGRRLTGPSGKHLMGTDSLGRDVLTRTLYGARQSLPIACIVIVSAVLIGCLIGALAGFFGGWIDAVLMRASDIVLAFPAILLAMAVTASLGPGLRNACIAMIAVWWPIYARLLRAQVIAVKQREHIEAARAVGATRGRIMRKHILPLSTTPILVNATMDFGQVVLLTASLSFIGLGAKPPAPEWGAMITDGAKDFYQWWIAVAPGVAIVSVVLAFNFIGDGLRDWLDPRSRTS